MRHFRLKLIIIINTKLRFKFKPYTNKNQMDYKKNVKKNVCLINV